ncbi:MAG: hypothetical protein RL515_1250 [Verrucomicrobiota bacterium]
MGALHRVKQVTRARLDGIGDQQTGMIERAALDQQKPFRQGLEGIQVGRARGTEVTRLGIVRPLLVVHPFDELGDQEVHVGVTLTMPMRGHVERHAIKERRKVSAMIEVEPPHEILIGLTAAGVLRDDQARDGLQHLARTEERTFTELHRARHADGGGISDAQQAVLTSHHNDLTEGLRLGVGMRDSQG